MKLGMMNRIKILMTGSIDDYRDAFIRGEPLQAPGISTETAMKFSAVNACIRVRAETFASVPILMYKKTKDGREPANDIPLYDVLHSRPNDEMAPFGFKETLMTNFDISGNCVAEKLHNQSGELIGLYPYQHDKVKIERSRETNRLEYTIGKDQKVLQRAKVLHVPNLSFDGVLGLSPISYAAASISLGLTYERFGNRFYENSAMPSGVFEHPNHLSDEAFNRLRKDLKENYTGLKNTGTPMILEEGMKWSPLTIKPVDAQLLESKNFQIEDICRIYRVPQHLVNKLDRCMPGDTLVYTTNGPKPIKDIRVGDEVWSVDNGSITPAKVTNTWDNGLRDIIEIKTTNRTVKCTGNHRLLVRRKTLRPLKPGETGGVNYNGQKMSAEWTNEYVMAEDLNIGDVLIAIGKVPDKNNNVAPNGRKLTVGFMEFAGLLIGDGNIKQQNGRPSHVSVARSDTASYMDHYRQVMQSEFKSYDGGNGRGDMSAVPQKPVCLTEKERSTTFASVIAANELTELGLSGTAFTKRVPGWIYQTSEEMRLSFLRGFLDADGTVDKLGRITFYSANKHLIDDIRHLCMGLGIPVTNTRSDLNKKPAPNSQTVVETRMWRFTCSDPGENRRIGSHDARYTERLKSGKPFCKKGRAYPRYGGKGFNENYLSLSKIVQVNKRDPEHVYDIEVDGLHCFIADGVVSHNSTNNNIEHQALEFVMYTMLPIFKRFEDNINMQLLTPAERKAGYYVEFKIDGLLRGDAQSRATAYATGRQWGWLSVNDIRRLENMQPLGPEGDIYLTPANMTDSRQVGQTAQNSAKLVEEIYALITEKGGKV